MIIGAGPVGLVAGIDMALQGIPVVILDDNDQVSHGSRAICFAKRSLEILDRLGCGQAIVNKGVVWNKGKVFVDDREIYSFDLQSQAGQHRPAFINLQQYHFESILVQHIRKLQSDGLSIKIRGTNKLIGIECHAEFSTLRIQTPEGEYDLKADWLLACDGANSTTRQLLGLEFEGQEFQDNFLIADVTMKADFPSERWFWFDPPFNRGQSALLHKQPDNLWRIDLQLGPNIDKEHEKKPENVIPRLKAMLSEDVEFDLEWVSIYTFQCRRMRDFRHKNVFFVGDSAHQVSPFGARGANGGIQDADNLVWKLQLVINGEAPETLLETFNTERIFAADENILNSTRSTDFITPKTDASRVFRDAVLSLAEKHAFARHLVNSGRLSIPAAYKIPNAPDSPFLPKATQPGNAAIDAPISEGWLLQNLGNRFQLLCIGTDKINHAGLESIELAATPDLRSHYLGDASCAFYLIRPDQHIAARWLAYDESAINAVLKEYIND